MYCRINLTLSPIFKHWHQVCVDKMTNPHKVFQIPFYTIHESLSSIFIISCKQCAHLHIIMPWEVVSLHFSLFTLWSLGTRAKFDLNLLGPASNWPQFKAAGGKGRPQKMAPAQVTSSNRTVVAKMFWMLHPAAIIKSQDIRLKPHNALILSLSRVFIQGTYIFHLIRQNKCFQLWSESIPINKS